MNNDKHNGVMVPEVNIPNTMRYAFDQLKTPYGIRDLSARLIYCNQPAADLLGAKSPNDIIGKYDREIDNALFSVEGVVEEFDAQYKRVISTQEPFSTLELHPHALDYPYIFKKMPFYNNNHECVGMFGYNIELTVYSLNDYVKGHMPGSLLLNKPDDTFTERECEVMFYRLQGLKSKEAAERLNLSLNTFNNYMQRIYIKAKVTEIAELREFCEKRNFNHYLPKRFLTKESINYSDSIT
ncbi:LuxR C-terminal-related transcriptional regulator [Acerihabitans sp.]|uniref:LuxR C-terminal-related transcriptional regulator n=1 Tax=Acerihabitans sp. TaxID=2811394 RepID=UPI002ED987EE